MELFDHQKKIVDEDKSTAGIFLGTGGGKTRVVLLLVRGKTLIIAPKTQVEDKNWEREKEKLGLNSLDITVISKEKFRKIWNDLPYYETVIGEEAHTLCGVTPSVVYRKRQPVPKTSQLFQAVLDYKKKHNPKRFYLVTATPTRSPMAVWGAAQLLGIQWDFYQFRQKFYIPLPMPGRQVWTPKKDEATKLLLSQLVKDLGYVGRLEDWFDVPEQTYKTEYFALTDEQKKRIKLLPSEFPDPLVCFGKKDQVENGILSGDEYTAAQAFDCGKMNRIMDLAEEFPKLLIFAKYTQQINLIAKMLRDEGKKVLILSGATKDKGQLIKEANESKECIVIAQSQISSGYELPSYPCVVFASLSGSLVDLVQAQGRVQRAGSLKKNLYIYLVTKGGSDEARFKTNMLKQDFHEAMYIKEQQ